MLAVMVGSAVGAWWLMSQQRSRDARQEPRADRGTVIFDNTPRAADADAAV